MIPTRDLGDEHQPDAVIDFVAAVCSRVRDAGATMQWWWLGEARVRLAVQRPNQPIITLELREISATHTRLVVRGRASAPLSAHDVCSYLLGNRAMMTFRRHRKR
jgi:hypothetical protein